MQGEENEPGDDRGLIERVPACKRWDETVRRRHRVRTLITGIRPEPEPSYIGLIEEPESDKIGICCSGGGIRSAAFNLGALQTLQRAGILSRAKYLAAVSGGSYIAAAFAMVAKTWEKAGEDNGIDSDPDLVNDRNPPFYSGSPEEQYLRNRSAYLAPAGAGKARLIFRIAFGLIMNLALVAAVLALAATGLALYYRHSQPGLVGSRPDDYATSASDMAAVAMLGAVGLGVLLGMASVLLRGKYDTARQALETWSLRIFLLAAAVFAVEFALPAVLAEIRNAGNLRDQTLNGSFGTLAGAIASGVGGLLAAVLIEIRGRVRDVKGVYDEATGMAKRMHNLGRRGRTFTVQTAAWLLGPLLVVGTVVAFLLILLGRGALPLEVPLGAGVVFILLYSLGDATAWSLHPFYRRRLCVAFAQRRIARVAGDAIGKAEERDYRKLVPLSESGVRPGPDKSWPTLLVCAAANVSDVGATPPGRGVTSFTFSTTAMGGPLVGGIGTKQFEDRMHPSRKRDFTLPAAVAMSGAALSPSMGKQTRRSVTFLLALANVRLGVWVPNPRRVESWLQTRNGFRRLGRAVRTRGERDLLNPFATLEREQRCQVTQTKRFLFPRPNMRYLLKELTGRNSVNDPFLYVTDGGHYENLGLVELLRRGCTDIYCFDASSGKTCGALGDAIALARSELGVEITIDPSKLVPAERGTAENTTAVGTIRFPHSDVTGRLHYVRSVVTEGVPYDVHAFRAVDAAFPHDSTADQLYTDQKFEAYRALGSFAAGEVLAHEPDVERNLRVA
jgi:hypothetical protein